MLRVLVFGGSGFIGSHLVDRLIKEGHTVTVFDLWMSEDLKKYVGKPFFQFVKGNILDDYKAKKYIRDVDVVYHLAGILGTSETLELYDVIHVTETNVIGALKLLKAALNSNVRCFIYPSTPHVPWLNPYKITKSSAEKYCKMFFREYGLKTIVFTLPNVYGPRERWKEAKFGAPYNYQKAVPTFIIKSLFGEPLPLFGDGNQASNYVYVSDVVEAMVKVAVCNSAIGKTIPLGTEHPVSVKNLAKLIISLTKSESDIQYLPMRRGETKTSVSIDPFIAERIIGFRPKITLEEGLRLTIPYYASKLGLKNPLKADPSFHRF